MEHSARKIIRVLPKGQITLPLSIRKRFHIKPDDVVELTPTKDALILKPIKIEENILHELRIKEWGRYTNKIQEALERLSKLPAKNLPKLCR